MNQRCLVLLTFLAVLSSGASGQTASAKPEKDLQYVLVLKEKANASKKEPDLKKAGAKELKRWRKNRLIEISRAKLEELRRDPAVLYLALVNDGTETDAPKYLIGEPDDTVALKVESNGDSTPPEWDSGVYSYDGSGNIKAIGATETYRYDHAQRLSTAVVNGETLTYTYDSFGNQIERRIGSAIVPSPADARTNHLDNAVYDRGGNQLSQLGNAQEYRYDATSMMVERKGDQPKRFIYTADDERIGTQQQGEWTWTIRDFSGKVLSTFESTDLEESWLWVWVESHHYRGGSLSSGVKIEERIRSPEGRFFHLDHLGTARLITNGARQKIALHDYHPFGKEQTKLNQEIVDWSYNDVEPMKFTGHERDFVTSVDSNRHDYLDYMHARYYSPSMGRFLSVDPEMNPEKIKYEPQQWNRYSYVVNNPLKYTDPDGKDKFMAWLLGDAFRDVSTWQALKGALSPGDMMSAVNQGRQEWAEDHQALTHGFSPVPSTRTEVAMAPVFMMLGPAGGPARTTLAEAKMLVGAWGKGTFPTLAKTIAYHFGKHGGEVGASNVLQYMRKAYEFNRNLRGAEKTALENGAIRYVKKGYYIIKDEAGNILSYGRVAQ